MFNEGSNRSFMTPRKRWIFMPLFFIAAVLLFGWVVQLLWNAILPDVTGVKVLDYPQALGLLVLSRILFGGFRGGGHPGKGPSFRNRRNQWMNMTDEERAQFKANWKEKCGK